MMKIKNLKLASLIMAMVMVLTCVPSVAFAEDLFGFESAEWDGGVAEEDQFVLAEEVEAPVADVVEDITFDVPAEEDLFDFSDEAAVAEDIVIEDDLLGDQGEGQTVGIDPASIRFYYNQPGYENFTVTYRFRGITEGDPEKTKGYWYTEENCKTLGLQYDATLGAAYNKVATCTTPEQRVMVAMIGNQLWHSVVEDEGVQAEEGYTTSKLKYFDIGEALGHNWSKTQVKATAEMIAATKKENETAFNATGVKEEVSATCFADGSYWLVYYCDRCGQFDTAANRYKEVKVPKLAHSYVAKADAKVEYEVNKDAREVTYLDKDGQTQKVSVVNTELKDGKPVVIDEKLDALYVVLTPSVCSVCDSEAKIGEKVEIKAAPYYDKAKVNKVGDNIAAGVVKGQDPKDVKNEEITFKSCTETKGNYYVIRHYDSRNEANWYDETVTLTGGHKSVTKYYDADKKTLIPEGTFADLGNFTQVFMFKDKDGKTLDGVTNPEAKWESIYGTWSCYQDRVYYTHEECANPNCPLKDKETKIAALGDYVAHTAGHKGPHSITEDVLPENAIDGKNDIEALTKDGKISFTDLASVLENKNCKDFVTCAEYNKAKKFGGFCHDTVVTVKYLCKVCRTEQKTLTVTVIGDGKYVNNEFQHVNKDKTKNNETIVDATKVAETEVAATCSARGHYDVVTKCGNCGDVISTTTIYTDKKDHSWTYNVGYEGKVVVDVSDPGKTGKLLNLFEEAKKQPVVYNHTLTYYATDTKLGVRPMLVRTCSVCGTVEEPTVAEGKVETPAKGKIEFVDKTNASKPVTYTMETKATNVETQPSEKTCVAGSVTLESVITKTVNGKDEQVTKIAQTFPYYTSEAAYAGADAHIPSGQWEIVGEKAADGSYTEAIKCLVCGAIISQRFVPAPSHVHAGVLVEGKAATCAEAGTKNYYYCAGCQGKFEDEACTKALTDEEIAIPALGHQYGEEIAEVAATCAAPGMKAHYVCSVCGKFFVKDGEEYKEVTAEELVITEQPAHTLVEVAEVPATDEADGVKAHYVCSVCGKLFVLDGQDYKEVTEADLVIPKPEEEVKAPGKVTIKSTSTYVGTGAIKVKVGTVEGADSYKIGIKEAGTKDYTTKTAEDMSVLFDNVKFDGKYVIRAYAKNAAGKGEYSYKRRWVHSVDVSLKAGEGSIVVNLDGEGDAYKYKIRVSTTKDMADYETYTTSKTSYTITGLKSGQKYYVRAIPYVKVDGKVYRGAMSSREAKTVK